MTGWARHQIGEGVGSVGPAAHAVTTRGSPAALPAEPVLQLRDLRVTLGSHPGAPRVVDGISLALHAGETLGLVGESGCGKSMTSLAVMGLLPRPLRANGSIRFEGRELIGLDRRSMAELRGNRVAMIFQEPMTSLNPALTVGEQIREVLVRHGRATPREAARETVALLDRVRIPVAARRAGDYPHQMSGGMRQRVMIAMALACGPALLIADEPTTALDVTVQAQILDLLSELQAASGMAILLISHDLGVISESCDRIAVLYGGRIAEHGGAHQVFQEPQHPYTVGLLGSIPRLDDDAGMLAAIAGGPPDPLAPSLGCLFEPRCPFRLQRCGYEPPPLRPVGHGRGSACWAAPL